MQRLKDVLILLTTVLFAWSAYAQSDDGLSAEIKELREDKEHLEMLRDSLSEVLREVDARIRDLEFERVRKMYGSEGQVALVTDDTCRLALGGTGYVPKKGSRVLVVGATRDGLWKVRYGNEQGVACDACLKFKDRHVDSELLMDAYVAEANDAFLREQHRLDSLAEVQQAREDSLDAVVQARMLEIALEERARLDVAGKSNYPFRIQDVFVAEKNSAGGVTMGITMQYLKQTKRIKYLYLTFIPYNSVGDQVACTIRGTSEFIGKVTGPIDAQYEPYYWFWETAWYNDAIECIKITKLRVEYTDGSSYVYIKELPKIFGDFNNLCAYK